MATSGAESGGKIASFLAGDDGDGVRAEGAAVIDQLVTHTPARADTGHPSGVEHAQSETQAHDEQVIGTLTGGSTDTRKPDAAAPAPDPEEQTDTGLIDSLIQKKDGDGKPKD